MSKEQSFVLFSYQIARVVHSFSMEQDLKGFQSYAARKVVFENIVSLLSGMSRHTQPDGTLFFLIFTLLWGISHWSFKNYGSNAAIYNLFKPEINKGEFRLYFELFEKKL